MRYYETMYIVDPSFEEGRLNKIIETLNDEFEKNKVKVINHYVWGKKRLAYPIHDHKYGNYIIIHFESEELNFLINFGMFLKLNEAVMRYQTVRLNKQPDVLELHDIIVENEMLDSDKTTEKQDNIIEESDSDKTTEKQDNIIEESDSDNAVSLKENDQEETEEEDVKSNQPEKKEDKR